MGMVRRYTRFDPELALVQIDPDDKQVSVGDTQVPRMVSEDIQGGTRFTMYGKSPNGQTKQVYQVDVLD